MAQFQLNLKYQTPQQNVAFIFACVLLPFWSILLPILLGTFIKMYFAGNIPISPFGFWLVLGLLILAIFAGIFFTALAEDDRLFITKEGISFPLRFLPKLAFKRTKFWEDLHEVDYISSANYLILKFKSLSLISLNLNLLAKEELEKFLLSIEMWGKNVKLSPAFIEFQESTKTNNSHSLTYTKMWEDELNRRFSNTAFIPLDPGAKLKQGKLEIVRQIAFGGFSAIYLAQLNKQDLVILKEIVIPQNANSEIKEKALQNFAKEAQLLAKLDHPNIVKVKDFFVEDLRQYLMMDYETGQDLRQLVSQNGLVNERDAIAIGLKITLAIQYLHSHTPPIIHRDISPDNIVLKNNGDILIIDFGAANEFMGTATGTLIGKQAYMAPEQLQGKATLASDIYGYGATLYFLLTGRDPMPLANADVKQVLPNINEDLNELIYQTTQFEINDRIKDIATVIASLERVAQKLADNEIIISQ